MAKKAIKRERWGRWSGNEIMFLGGKGRTQWFRKRHSAKCVLQGKGYGRRRGEKER